MSESDATENLNRTLSRLREDIVRMQQGTEVLVKTVQESSVQNTRSLGQLRDALLQKDLLEKITNLSAVGVQLEFEERLADQAKAEHSRRLARAQDRIDKNTTTLQGLAAERVREVGQHIYDVAEEISSEVKEYGRALSRAMDCLLQEGLQPLGEQLNHLQDLARAVLAHLDELDGLRDEADRDVSDILHPLECEGAVRIRVPVWRVKIRTPAGREVRSFAPARLRGPRLDADLEERKAFAILEQKRVFNRGKDLPVAAWTASGAEAAKALVTTGLADAADLERFLAAHAHVTFSVKGRSIDHAE